MFCRNCGKMVEDGNKFCTGCGTKVIPIGAKGPGEIVQQESPIQMKHSPVENQSNSYVAGEVRNDNIQIERQDKVNVWLVILGFLIPIAGLILFLSLHKKMPKRANAIGIAALIGFMLFFVLLIFAVYYITLMIITDDYFYPETDYNDYHHGIYNEDYDDYYERYYEDYYDELYNIFQDRIKQNGNPTI